MYIAKRLLLSLIAVALVACQPATNQSSNTQSSAQNLPQVQTSNIQAHMQFLADDLLQGRETGSVEHEIASLYIATEFQKYGIQPAGENGSYYQHIPFRQAFLDQDSPELTITTEQGEFALEYPKDYIASANTAHAEALAQGQLVFAGYGIVAPQLNHDDYAELDVKGKVVVVLHGKPASFPSEEGAHFGSTSEKKRHAVERGAVGYISISTPVAEKVRPYQNLLNYLHVPSVSALDDNGKPIDAFPELANSAYLSQDAARKIFANAKMDLASIYQMLEENQSPQGFDLKASIRLFSRSEFSTISSPNVIGVLPGSDPELKNEYVVYSAHSDHIGIAKTVKKDKINNGAMDNASGTAVMLETARLFAQMPNPPKRSVLFVAVTAEEKGLLGSKYFANNPTVPIENIVANVNLDMPILTYEFGDVIAFGANHSDMQDSVSQAAQQVGIELSPDPWPEMALFTRSDHYSFVQQGIPAVFLVPGLKSSDPEVDGSKMFGAFIASNYHKPSDDMNQPFNWKAANKFTQVNFQIGLTLANQEQRSKWHEGDFFGEVFGRK